MNGNNMPAETGLGALLLKIGGLKLIGLGAALLGAGIMAIFRPPRTRQEMFMQGAVALGTSLLFGGYFVGIVDGWTDYIDLTISSLEDKIQFITAVYGLLGAMSWGIFGGLSVLRDKFGSDPIQTVKDIKDV